MLYPLWGIVAFINLTAYIVDMASYKNNHTLSECLLKRFTNDQGDIVRFDSNSTTGREVPYGSQGFKKGLWQRTTKQFMETLWNDLAERHMTNIFRKLDNHALFTAEEKNVLIRFLALHYVRSEEFIRVYKGLLADHARTDHFDMRLSFYERYYLRLEFLKESGIPSQFFEDTMKTYYEVCIDYLSGMGLEIGVAGGDETLILPDGGLLLADATAQYHQPSGGIGLKSAVHAVMPLGPRHLIAFTSKSSSIVYLNLSDEEVRNANANLKHAVIEAYYTLPHSNS